MVGPIFWDDDVESEKCEKFDERKEKENKEA